MKWLNIRESSSCNFFLLLFLIKKLKFYSNGELDPWVTIINNFTYVNKNIFFLSMLVVFWKQFQIL